MASVEAPSGSLAGHIAKRLLMALCGYVLGLVVGMVALVLIMSVGVAMGLSPFGAETMVPIVSLFMPGISLFVLIVAAMVTAPMALIVFLITEGFSIRALLPYLAFGAAIGALSGPVLYGTAINESSFMNYTLMAITGAVGGLVYWLVAGRDAGFRRSI